MEKTQVLIVGAGPAGLALAIELGRQGIQCNVVERNDRVGYAPRAKTTNVRTREHLRRWGIADRLRDRSPFGLNYPSDVIFATRLSRHLLARIENAFYCNPKKDPRYAEHAQWIPQYTLEDVLREYAETLPGVHIRFQHLLEDITQDEQGVTSRVRERRSGSLLEFRSDYVVGADGSRSRMREIIGARMEGVQTLSRNYNTVIHAPGFEQAHGMGRGIMYWMVNNELPALIAPMDSGDRLIFMPTYVPEGVTISPEEVPRQIFRATGLDLSYKVLSSDEWEASQLIADRYRDRRAFLIGDACHLHPPFGGYGMNMGVGDGVDLGWKMAAVLRGWGGPALLASYEIERRPVHKHVIDEAVANHALLGNQLRRDEIEDDSPAGERVRKEIGELITRVKPREFHALGVVKGYFYENSPILIRDGSTPPPMLWRHYQPSASPGCIAPHAWLEDGSSLYDHLGKGYTLLITDNVAATPDALQAAAEASGTPLSVLRAPQVLHDLYGASYALIRPDQHVAWRGNAIEDAAGLLERVCGRTGTAA